MQTTVNAPTFKNLDTLLVCHCKSMMSQFLFQPSESEWIDSILIPTPAKSHKVTITIIGMDQVRWTMTVDGKYRLLCPFAFQYYQKTLVHLKSHKCGPTQIAIAQANWRITIASNQNAQDRLPTRLAIPSPPFHVWIFIIVLYIFHTSELLISCKI